MAIYGKRSLTSALRFQSLYSAYPNTQERLCRLKILGLLQMFAYSP